MTAERTGRRPFAVSAVVLGLLFLLLAGGFLLALARGVLASEPATWIRSPDGAWEREADPAWKEALRTVLGVEPPEPPEHVDEKVAEPLAAADLDAAFGGGAAASASTNRWSEDTLFAADERGLAWSDADGRRLLVRSSEGGDAAERHAEWVARLAAGHERSPRGAGVELVRDDALLDIGDALAAGRLLRGGEPVGVAVVARAGERVAWVEWEGWPLPQREELEAFLAPRLGGLLGLER